MKYLILYFAFLLTSCSNLSPAYKTESVRFHSNENKSSKVHPKPQSNLKANSALLSQKKNKKLVRSSVLRSPQVIVANKFNSKQKVNKNTQAVTQLDEKLKNKMNRSQLEVKAYPQKKKIEIVRTSDSPPTLLAPQTLNQSSESGKELFINLQKAYEKNEYSNFKIKYNQLLEVKNIDSSFYLQAHYLMGLISYSHREYGDSLKAFDLIITNEKASAGDRSKALFGKGVTYKKLNISEMSQKIFNDIIKEYPQSFEANRAQAELGQLLQSTGSSN